MRRAIAETGSLDVLLASYQVTRAGIAMCRTCAEELYELSAAVEWDGSMQVRGDAMIEGDVVWRASGNSTIQIDGATTVVGHCSQ